ncbi:MBL fold metallo-hydrolase [Thermococcus aggregans]|uniref:MBL fold metallo-hydrolase n=1 Tax=Thermococcus aggregans TaxID=110163 RepID=A0A9E7SPH7_THEAG|nr:MBL fold metallo-hydrolase [Thermococcus aggregans]USS41573.1 MBL fold metallo-hydrolase [Thermococcus aggregans]
MGELKVDFKFHNVGQGLFYTGRLTYGKASFNFVYDCGSEKTNLVNKAINREFSGNKKGIDLLIISHLHKDHVSGIPHLLKITHVDTVILPYLTPIERLLVALQTPVAPREFYEFLADPVMFLLDSRKVNRVILVGGGEPSDRENWLQTHDMPSDLPPNGEFIIDLERLPNDEILRSEIKKLEPNVVGDRRVLVKNHSGVLPVLITKSPIWIFRFFNYKVRSNKIFQFENCVKRILGDITPETIKDAIRDRNIKSELEDCYKSNIHSKLNETSLLTLHLPVFNPRNNILCYNCGCFRIININFVNFNINSHNLMSTNQPREAFSQFLTGDINLNRKRKYKEIAKHFGFKSYTSKKPLITDTMVTLIPHHGAKGYWNNAICMDISSRFWVVSAGINNKYGHPSLKVLWDIWQNCQDSCVVWVNEAVYFRLMGILQF